MLGDLFPGLLGEFATGEAIIIDTISRTASAGKQRRAFIVCLA